MARFEEEEDIEIEEVKSPQKKKAKTNVFDENLKEILDENKVKQRHEKLMDKFEAKGIPVLERSQKTFEELMEEKDEKHKKEIEKKKNDELHIFSGVTILVSKKLNDIRDELYAIVSSLGGSFRDQYNSDEITHFIFSGAKTRALELLFGIFDGFWWPC